MDWTITELALQASAALAGERLLEQSSGRVRDLPNERLIRWYSTIGLVDPPLSRRGRTARYGRRHLLQLVAVKRRQAEGRALADIQAELTGATDATLRAIADLPPDTPDPSDPSEQRGAIQTAASDTPLQRRARFWAERPSAPVVHGVRLAPGITLLLDDGAPAPTPAEAAELVAAARPLLDLLALRIGDPL